MTFLEQLQGAERQNGSLLCVGLDPEPGKFPASMKGDASKIYDFCAQIVDATADLAISFKPQIAYFAAHRAENQLEKLMAHMRRNAPHVPVILDAKRGDIGSTAEQYAKEAFERYGADAVTVNPYLGRDSVEPFLAHADKGVVILCRTSNAGARELQDLQIDGRKLYQIVAEKVAREWNTHGNCLLVVGATYPAELADIRSRTGDMTFLVPGIGAQGGDVEQAVRSGRRTDGRGLIVNSSRGIIYAGSGEDFAAAARRATLELRAAINAVR